MEKPKEKSKIKLILYIFISIILIVGIIVITTITENNQDKQEANNTLNLEETNNYWDVEVAKPVIYLYPTETIKINVKLGRPEDITCSYPKYEIEGWNIIAEPNGNLKDVNTGRELYCLYWEGKKSISSQKIEEGFVVEGKNTSEFLEQKLELLGLTQKEAQEFIIYWLPKMEKNKYNYIRFQTIEEINQYMPLEITPIPDNIIRINMEWKPLETYVEVKEQKLETTPLRDGFTVVEWGVTYIE